MTKCFSILLGLIFVESRSGKTRRPNGLIAVGLRSYSSKNCGENVTLKAGLDGLAASLIAYWRESFSLRKVNDGSSASTYKLVTGEVRNAPKDVITDSFLK